MLRFLFPVVLALASFAAAAQTKAHWYGQAAFRIETPSGGVILIDPWLKAPTNPDKESVEKLTRVDYILITHGHWDHVGDAVEIGKKTAAVLVAPYGLQFAMKSVLGYPEKQATLATGGNVGGTASPTRSAASTASTRWPTARCSSPTGTPARFRTGARKAGSSNSPAASRARPTSPWSPTTAAA